MINIFKMDNLYVRAKKKEEQRRNNIMQSINNTIQEIRNTCNTKDKKISFMFEITGHWNLFTYDDEVINNCFEATLVKYERDLIEQHLLGGK